MSSLPRKRKGPTAPSASTSLRRSKRHHPAASCSTAPPAGRRHAALSATRGLKRKLGCVDPLTQIGRRRRRLDTHYLLGPQIGEGKFGKVYSCTHKSTGIIFACKALVKKDVTVHSEVEIMQHLSGHPGVVNIKAVFEDAENFYLVMEMCPGGRLLTQIERAGRFDEDRAAKVMRELVLVLRYCHEMGVVHRDVKPENILLTASGSVKLADFGLAVRVAKGQKLSGFVGSPAYLAPEVILGPCYSEKVDIWGAGILLHAMLVGALPFRGNSTEATYEAIKKAELDFCDATWESISDHAKDLLRRMLTRDVETRMTADEVLGHSWILLHTDRPPKLVPSELNIDGMTIGSSSVVPTKVGVKNRSPSTVLTEVVQDNKCTTTGSSSAFLAESNVQNNHVVVKGSSSAVPTESSVKNHHEISKGSSSAGLQKPSAQNNCGTAEESSSVALNVTSGQNNHRVISGSQSLLPTKVRAQTADRTSNGSSSMLPTNTRPQGNNRMKRGASALSSWSREEPEVCGFVDALADAISRMRISEPKRSRLCSPASPIQQESPSTMKANLCTAAF